MRQVRCRCSDSLKFMMVPTSLGHSWSPTAQCGPAVDSIRTVAWGSDKVVVLDVKWEVDVLNKVD